MLRAMWNSFRTDARDGLTAEVITYSGGGGDEIHAYVARPGDGDPGPGVVVAAQLDLAPRRDAQRLDEVDHEAKALVHPLTFST